MRGSNYRKPPTADCRRLDAAYALSCGYPAARCEELRLSRRAVFGVRNGRALLYVCNMGIPATSRRWQKLDALREDGSAVWTR